MLKCYLCDKETNLEEELENQAKFEALTDSQVEHIQEVQSIGKIMGAEECYISPVHQGIIICWDCNAKALEGYTEKITTIYQVIQAYAKFKEDLEQDGHTACTPAFFFEVYAEQVDLEQVIESINQLGRQ